MGIKTCPNCSAYTQKNEGCNHMTCKSCSIHYCWKCLAQFKNGNECMQHVISVHGSLFDREARVFQPNPNEN